jgi:predicted aspartyl protease
MVNYGDALFVDLEMWNQHINKYSNTLLTFDTGAVITTVSKEILINLGCNVQMGAQKKIITASGVEFVREVIIHKIKIGDFEIDNVIVYAHSFPPECFSSGVLGLNVLSLFDINLLFSSQKIELVRI